MRCGKKKQARTAFCAELVFFFFFFNRKKLQINQSNDLYQAGKLKEKKRKKERSTHTTFLANAIVRFVLQNLVFIKMKSLVGNQTSERTFVHQYRQVL